MKGLFWPPMRLKIEMVIHPLLLISLLEQYVIGFRYNIIHFYCLAVGAGFYSDVVECLPVYPATWVRFPAGTGKIFSLYDNGAHRK